MAFDDIFDYIGEMGAYQIALFILLGVPCMYGGFQAMAMIFLGPDHDHWCAVEDLSALPYQQQKYVSIPYDWDSGAYERCDYYNLPYENYSTEEFCNWDWSKYNGTDSVTTLKCDQWVYDLTQYASTAVSEYDLVCGRAFYVGLVYSSYILALLISVSVTGILSDYFGRKPILLIASVFAFVSCLIGAFAPNYAVFLTFRFFTAFGCSSATTCCFVLITEYVGPRYRVVTGTIFWCFYSLGYMILPIAAYIVTDFRLLQIILAFIMAPPLLYFFIIHESPRWSVMHDKVDNAMHVLELMAKVNCREFPEDARAIITSDIEVADEKEDVVIDDKSSSENWRILFTNSTMRKTIALNVPAWIASSVVYNGLSFNIGDLAGNIYVNTFIFAFVEIPANFLAWALMYFIGRRRMQVISLMAAGGFLLLCIPFTSSEGSTVVTVLAMVGKAFITVSYTTIFLFTAEMFPTSVRHLAHGACNTFGNIAGMLAPFMGAPLMAVWTPLPLLIFGLAGVLTGPLLLLLPETGNRALPDTLEEAEALWGKQSRILPSDEPDLRVSKL